MQHHAYYYQYYARNASETRYDQTIKIILLGVVLTYPVAGVQQEQNAAFRCFRIPHRCNRRAWQGRVPCADLTEVARVSPSLALEPSYHSYTALSLGTKGVIWCDRVAEHHFAGADRAQPVQPS